jgi:hypothetical protein
MGQVRRLWLRKPIRRTHTTSGRDAGRMTTTISASMIACRQTTPRDSKAENEVEPTQDIDPKRRKESIARQNTGSCKMHVQPPDEVHSQPAYLPVPFSWRQLDGHRPARDDSRSDMFGAQHTDGTRPGHRHRSGRAVGTGGAIVMGQEFPPNALPAA